MGSRARTIEELEARVQRDGFLCPGHSLPLRARRLAPIVLILIVVVGCDLGRWVWSGFGREDLTVQQSIEILEDPEQTETRRQRMALELLDRAASIIEALSDAASSESSAVSGHARNAINTICEQALEAQEK